MADESTDAGEVALATAAAPTYFSPAVVKNMISNPSFFDGGVWANCPAMAAIVEAVCYLDVPLDRIDVLSIGTTDEPFTVKMMGRAGWMGWGLKLFNLLMNAQVDSSLRHAQLLVGEPRFLRINTTTTPGLYALDSSKEIESLIALGNRRASDPEILYQVKSRFLNGISAMDWKSSS
jgi:patatin-like phospholipase/acyl hydrolase